MSERNWDWIREHGTDAERELLARAEAAERKVEREIAAQNVLLRERDQAQTHARVVEDTLARVQGRCMEVIEGERESIRVHGVGWGGATLARQVLAILNREGER